MKLIKVRDNANRPIDNLDVMVGAVFGDKIPREFVVDKFYKAGERVYAFDSKGRLNVWICNISGRFKSCKEPNFSEWSINSVIEGANQDKDIFLPEDLRTPMYECKSGVSPRDTYMEYDGKAHFDTNIEGFNLSDYNGENDQIDIYLRRDHSDHYLRKEDYRIAGKKLSVALPLEDMVDETTQVTCFIPEGRILSTTNGEKYWYVDTDGKTKTTPYDVNGIQMLEFDILGYLGKPIEYGYKIHNLKVLSVQTVVPSPLNPQLENKLFRMREIEITRPQDRISNELDESTQLSQIQVVVDAERGMFDIVDISYSKATQLISMRSRNGYVHQVKFEITMRKDKPISIFMIGSKAINPMTKYIRTLDEYGEVVEINGEHLIKMPKFDLLRHNSFEFELYVDRVFRSDYEEIIDEETGQLYIRIINDNGIDWNTSTFLFHIFYCITQMAAIIKTHDEHVVDKDTDAFRLMLSSSFVNRFQWLKMREDSKLIPPEVSVGSKNTANITNEDYYLQKGQKLKADVFSMVFRENIQRRNGSLTTICNSESYPIFEDTKDLLIPFIDYNPIKDDFLLFRPTGVLISAAKWYLNNDHVNMYVHENPLKAGDCFDFRMLDRDETVRVDNHFYTVNMESKSIDTGIDLSKAAFYLLFSISGQYISPLKYTVNGSVITFKPESADNTQPYLPAFGVRVELIVGTYKHSYSKTLYKMIRVTATENDQKEFILDGDLDYNPQSDNLLIFQKNGLYIGERFYHTDEKTGKIILDNGSGLSVGDYIDILLIRSLKVRINPATEVEEI